MDELEKCSNELISRNSLPGTNQNSYAQEYSKLEKKYNTLVAKASSLNEKLNSIISEKQSLKVFMSRLEKLEILVEFKEKNLRTLVNRILTDGQEIRIIFKNGSEYRNSFK